MSYTIDTTMTVREMVKDEEQAMGLALTIKAARHILDNAPLAKNYVSLAVAAEDGSEGFDFIVMRPDGISPAQKAELLLEALVEVQNQLVSDDYDNVDVYQFITDTLDGL